MASPFRVFRKHQKILIATLGLMAMIAFVFLSGPVLDAIMSGGQSRDPVRVSTTAYGNLRASEVSALTNQRQMLLGIFEQILVQGAIPPQFVRQAAIQIFGPAEEDAVVNSWLAARRAESLGMVVNDREINAFLRNFLSRATNGEFTSGDLAKMLSDRRIPQAALFSALHRELLAQKLFQTFQPSAMAAPPLQRWTFYRQLNQQVTTELLPIEVEQYIDEVPTPSDAELRKFFEKHKDDEWRPESSTPGFRQPTRIALTYFEADFDAFFDPAAVPNEEVREYYEQTKDTLYRASGSESAGSTLEPPADELAEPDTTEQTTDEGDESGSTEDEEDTADTTDAADDELAEGAGESQPTPEHPADEASEDQAEEDKGDADGQPEEAPLPEQDDQSRTGPRAPVRFVALNQAEGSDDASDPESADGPTDVPADDATDDADSASAKDTPDGGNELAGESHDSPESESDAEAAPLDEPEPEAPTVSKPEYKPLTEVEGDIRQFLGRRKAEERMMEVLSELQGKVRRYYDELTVYQVDKDEDTDVEPPEPLDLKTLAKEHGLSVYETEPISVWEARTLGIGDAVVQGQPVWLYLFNEQRQPALHRPEIAEDRDGTRYLFWVEKRQEEYTPEWDDAMREQALTAWKLVEARDLTRGAAEELAKQSRKADKPLAELPKVGSKAFTAGPFSWLTYGNVPASMARGLPELGEVDGVEFAGDEFMATAYRLSIGEVGVAMNQPETTVYLIRPIDFEPDGATLWDRFLSADLDKYRGAALRAQVEIAQAWRDELQRDAGLEWHALPTRQAGQ